MGNTQQALPNLLLGPFLRQGPAQTGCLRALEVIADGAGGHRATASDLPDGKVMLILESKYFFDLTHGYGLSCHCLPFSL
jgi:hypothetical protein